jgi:hypothetical protein
MSSMSGHSLAQRSAETGRKPWRLALCACLLVAVISGQAVGQQDLTSADGPAFPGMDESVNEALAEEAGVPSRDPLLDTESMGELWNLLLLAAGGVCGFLLGRHWDQLWGKRPPQSDDDRQR